MSSHPLPEDAGFSYDSTVGYNQTVGYRAARPSLRRRRRAPVELPRMSWTRLCFTQAI
jgi:hypothetical protein